MIRVKLHLTSRQHMAEKPPVTSGKETIDCVVYMRGKRLYLSVLELVSTKLFYKASSLPFFVLISVRKWTLFPRQARMKIAFVSMQRVFLLFSRYPQCSRKSLLIKILSLFFFGVF